MADEKLLSFLLDSLPQPSLLRIGDRALVNAPLCAAFESATYALDIARRLPFLDEAGQALFMNMVHR